MEQVYIATAIAFAIIGRQAFINWRAERIHRKSHIGHEDAEGRIWLILDREYIEE